MKAFVRFDASVGSYDIQSQLFMVRSLNGVKSVELLRKQEGDGPQYCIEIEADDTALRDLTHQVQSVSGQFAGYISNLTFAAFARA
jgi:hypothetical protein